MNEPSPPPSAAPIPGGWRGWRKKPGLYAGEVGVLGVAAVLVAGLSVGVLLLVRITEADGHGLVTGLEGEAHRIGALEWEPFADSHPSPSPTTGGVATESLSPSAETDEPWRDTIVAELVLLDGGKVAEVRELEEAAVDPRFDELARVVDRTATQHRAAESRAYRLATLGAFALLVMGSTGSLWLFYRFGKARGEVLDLVTREALARSEERLRALIENASDVIAILDADERAVWVSAPFERVYRRSADALLGVRLTSLALLEDAPALEAFLRRVREEPGAGHTVEIRLLDGEGQTRHTVVTGQDRRSAPGIRGLVLNLRDDTARRTASEHLRGSEERYAIAAQRTNDGIWDWDLDAGTVYYSPRWRQIFGLQDEEVGTRPDEWFDRTSPEDLPRLRDAISAHLAGDTPSLEVDCRVRRSDGETRWALVRGVALRDPEGKAIRMGGSLTDITDLRRMGAELRYAALHDALTGLPNRVFFMERLRLALDCASRKSSLPFGVLLVDLDRLKQVNDSLGHAAGDQIITETARRLEADLRPSDVVARLAGDAFAVLLDALHGETAAAKIAERVLERLAAPITIGGLDIVTTVSIGLAFHDRDTHATPEDLLRDADTALHQAKARGSARWASFRPPMHSDAVNRLQLETDLRGALVTGEALRVYYQPIYDLIAERLVGFEALVRWQHPTRGMVGPDLFLPIAEETGLVVRLGSLVLLEACRQAVQWRSEHPDRQPLVMSVNLSARQLVPALVAEVDDVLRETGLEPSALRLEITESMLMEDIDGAILIFNALSERGISLAIDDFGTGYSSFRYLTGLPVDYLKIDRSFVDGIESQPDKAAVVRTILTMAAALGMRCTAEGIETNEQLSRLREMGCHTGQGYLLARPTPATVIDGLLERPCSFPPAAVAVAVVAAVVAAVLAAVPEAEPAPRSMAHPGA